MVQQQKIMYGEKAAQVTVTLPDGSQHQQWFCTKCRRIWGDKYPANNHMASWCCCTHMICECGKEHEKHWTCCNDCRAKKSHEKWYAKPEVEWNGEWPIYDHSSDKYFMTDSDLMDYLYEDAALEDIEAVAESLRLSSCHQNNPRYFEVNEWVNDDLGEDSDGVSDNKSIDERINAILSEIGIVSYLMNSDRLNVQQVLKAIGYGAAK